MKAIERLLKYVSVHTTSDEAAQTRPSSQGQLHLARHMRLARRAGEALLQGAAAMEAGEPLDLCAVHLHEALYALGEVTGDQVTEDLLDRVFGDFCVGK